MNGITRIDNFDEWAASLGLCHFRAHELRTMGGSHYDPRSKAYGLNRLPARKLWPNIVAIARAADECRRRLGQPMLILSGYRSPAYNAAVGGAKQSRHLFFNALDLTVPGFGTVYLKRTLRDLRAEGWFTGGIGTYRNFIHIDNRGHNVDF